MNKIEFLAFRCVKIFNCVITYFVPGRIIKLVDKPRKNTSKLEPVHDKEKPQHNFKLVLRTYCMLLKFTKYIVQNYSIVIIPLFVFLTEWNMNRNVFFKLPYYIPWYECHSSLHTYLIFIRFSEKIYD